MPSSPRRRGAVVRAVHDSAVGRHPMIQPWHSERSPVACVPRVAVESGRRGVAGQTHVRRWPRTTRCNELAVIVMRDGEPEGRESLIAAVRATMDTAVEFSSLVVVLGVVALCVAFSLVVVRACLIAPATPGVLQQLLILGAAILLFSGVGGMLIAPTGPGSGWPVF